MHPIVSILVAVLLFVIPNTVTVTGRILNREGKPLVKATVSYEDTATGRTYTAKTDKNGEFVMAGLTDGYYKVVIKSAEGERVFSGNKNVRRVNEDERYRRLPGEEPNELNVDLSTVSSTGQMLESPGNSSHGKLNKEQLDLVRQENAKAAKLNRLITELHVQLDAQNWPDATETLRQLIGLDPNRWEFYQNLGAIQSNLTHYQDAAKTLAKGVEIAEKVLANANDAAKAKADIGGMLIAEGDAYNRLNQVDEALALYEKAAATLPQPGLAYQRACNTLSNHGRAEEAIDACSRAIAADGTQWDYYQLLASAQVMAGKKLEAVASYDKGIELARKAIADSPRAKNGLGQMLTAKGNLYSQLYKFEEAAAVFQEAAQWAPYPALPYYNLCAMYYNLSRMDEAVKACDQAIAGDAGMAEAYYIKGTALFSKGERKGGKFVAPPETRDVLNKYLGLSPFGAHADAARGLLEKLDADVDEGEQHAGKK